MLQLSGTLSGSFTGTGNAISINLVSDVDWMYVYNFTNAGATGDDGVRFYWQRGMAVGTGVREFKSGGGNNLNLATLAAPAGFTLVDTTTNSLGAIVATTASTNATQPVISTANTGDLVAGDTVLLFNIAGQPNIGGWPYTIDTVVANTSFRIKNALANAPGAAGTTGFYQKVNYPEYWYPQTVYIANISQAAQAVVTVNVDIAGNIVIGQKVRFSIPAEWGMVELDGLDGTVVAVTATTFTVDVNTTGFTAFTFPTVANATTTRAHAFAYGETATSPYENLLDDAVENVGFRGMRLGGGAQNPGGGAGDVLYWVAGKAANQ